MSRFPGPSIVASCSFHHLTITSPCSCHRRAFVFDYEKMPFYQLADMQPPNVSPPPYRAFQSSKTATQSSVHEVSQHQTSCITYTPTETMSSWDSIKQYFRSKNMDFVKLVFHPTTLEFGWSIGILILGCVVQAKAFKIDVCNDTYLKKFAFTVPVVYIGRWVSLLLDLLGSHHWKVRMLRAMRRDGENESAGIEHLQMRHSESGSYLKLLRAIFSDVLITMIAVYAFLHTAEDHCRDVPSATPSNHTGSILQLQ